MTERKEKDFEERVLEIKRVSRTVSGGKRMRFRALMVIGDRNGKVGMAVAKGNDVQEAVAKASRAARKKLIRVPIINDTIPHERQAKYGSSNILIKPAVPGTSLIAGGAVRTVLELAGVKNVVAKIYGSTNKINTARATLEILKSLRAPKILKNTTEDTKEQKDQPVEGAEKTIESPVANPTELVKKSRAKK